MFKVSFFVALLCLASWLGAANAQYVLELKNGRQITIQSYREEGAMIKFSGLGGEIAISKDQVQTIRRAGASESASGPTFPVDRPTAPTSPERAPALPPPSEIKPSSPPVPTDQQIAKKRAEEEKAYQDKVKQLTEQLKELRDRYSMMTRGNKGPEPFLFTTEEAFRGQQEDLLSRLRDAQNRAQGLPTGSAATSPPFSLDPPPAYSTREKELSDMRSRINQVENDRQRLIEEMKAKNFETGSLFLE
jgi:hypothetical protein